MQVFLDNLVFAIQRAGGVSTYWYQLFEQLLANDIDLTVLNARVTSGNVLEQRIDYSRLECVRESRLPARLLRYLPLRCKLPRRAVFHAGYLRVSRQRDVLNILTVHDFVHERKLATRFPRSLVNTLQKAHGINHADGIICVSESTRRDLFELYPNTAPEKVKVIYHGIAPDFSPLSKSGGSGPPLSLSPGQKFVLYVGGRANYKNFDVAVDTVAGLDSSYHLVAVGGETWNKTAIYRLKKNLGTRYHILPTVDVATMNALYNHAFCLLYPSAYEGFGFPPAEAMKAGCPVVTTTRTSIPEIVGAAGLLVEEISAPCFAQKIHLLEDSAYRQHAVSAGLRQAALFTWERCGRETVEFYRDRWRSRFS